MMSLETENNCCVCYILIVRKIFKYLFTLAKGNVEVYSIKADWNE